MFPRLGPMELIILLAIVVLFFGPGRIGKVAGEIGKGIKSFREGLNADKSDDQPTDSKENIEPK